MAENVGDFFFFFINQGLTECKKELAVHYLCAEAHWVSVVRSICLLDIRSHGRALEKNSIGSIFLRGNEQFVEIDQDLCQGTMSVREYEREFNLLRRFAVRENGEQATVSRFLEGFIPDIRNRCAIWAYGSLIELVEKSVRMKARLLEEAKLLKSTQAKMTKGAELFWWSQQV